MVSDNNCFFLSKSIIHFEIKFFESVMFLVVIVKIRYVLISGSPDWQLKHFITIALSKKSNGRLNKTQ